jgi:tetratricopeptide (TPR) repeat protein
MQVPRRPKKPIRPVPSRLEDLWTTPLQAISLVVLTLAAYWNALDGAFHFDDQGLFLDLYVVGPGFGWKLFRLIQTRPLTFLTFHWNYLLNGNDPWGFHLINLLVHAANSILVLLVARRALQPGLAWFAAALFAIHPLQTQAVNYVFERATLLATFFALLSLLLFIEERYWGAVVAFGLSLLAKEETIALPAFFLVYDLATKRRPAIWRCYLPVLSLAALAATRLFYTLHNIPEAQLAFNTKGVSQISYVLTESRVMWIYVRLFFLPVGLSLDHDVRLSQNLWSPTATLPAVLALALVVGALAWYAWRGTKSALWALGFFVLLSPSSTIVPASDLLFEHRTYLPLACLAIAAALLLAQILPRRAKPALPLLLIMLLVGTIVRNRVWKDDRSLWSDVIEKAPHKARGYFHLGQSYASENPTLARQLYDRGLEIDPYNADGHANLGLILLSQEDPENALSHLHKALALGGEKSLVWNNIGSAELRRGQIEEGIEAFRKALDNDPCRFDARWNLIHTLSSLGETEDARVAGHIPATCRFLPEQGQKLDDELRSLQ